MDTEQSAAMGTCIQALVEELRPLAAGDRELERFVAEARRASPCRGLHGRRVSPDHPAMPSLDRALRNVPPGSRLGDAVVAVAPRLDWFQVFVSDEIDPQLASNMISAELSVRRDARIQRTLLLGLFLLAPGTRYPLHTHTASEVYYCVSGKLTLQHGIDGAPFLLCPGEYSITPSERLHALRTEEEPVLLIYIWLAGPTSENWWWARRPDGSWERSAWQWRSDGRWVRLGCEPVSAETMRRAGGAHHGPA